MLTTYAGDLNYFATFIRFSKGEISPDAYARKDAGTFKNFIDEYRVARNTKRDLTADLLACSLDWHQKGRPKEVDEFARMIQEKGLTHGKVATSLSSKIMYLINRWEVMPLDDLAKKALNHRSKDYIQLGRKSFALAAQYLAIKTDAPRMLRLRPCMTGTGAMYTRVNTRLPITPIKAPPPKRGKRQSFAKSPAGGHPKLQGQGCRSNA